MKTEQRVIKFRCWDTENKRMVYPDGVFHFIANGKLFKLDPLIREDRYFDMGLDVKIMQFTGLVDKEGNEIYEGDLVKDSAPWVWTVRFGEIISDGIRYVGWYLEHPEREDFSGPFTSEDTSVLKIVGNTFQGLLPSTTTI